MEENKKDKKEQEYIEKVVIEGKKISIEASRNKKLEEKIKKLSSY